MLIIGIDPGLQKTGWGIIRVNGNNLSFVACGTVSSNAKDGLAERIADLHTGIKSVVDKYQPAEAAIEETFVNKNAMSSLKLGHARGAAILSLSLSGLPVSEYAARLVKKTVVGKGSAEKEQVQMMVSHILPGAKFDGPDAADALAVAICHASHRNLKKILAV